MSVTPVIGSNSTIVTGGTSVIAVPVNPNGGYITNPYLAADQGIAYVEPIYIDPTGGSPGSSPGSGNGSVTALEPGQTWNIIPNQSTVTNVNAATSGHKFTVVHW